MCILCLHPVRCRHNLLTQGTNWGTAGWSWAWGDGEDIYRRGKNWRVKVVTALLCLIREFCFRIVKGLMNIQLSLFCDWDAELEGAMGVLGVLAVLWLLCECELFWKQRSTRTFQHSCEYAPHLWAVALYRNMSLIADDFHFLPHSPN